jgi:alpha-tubulin suppressor-like RCC1 family protein
VQATVTVAPQFTHLATGELHACGITGRRDVYCWGTAFYGEIGPPSGPPDCSDRFGGDARCSAVPVQMPGLHPVEIVAGDMHTCALDADGTAYCWGANFYGQTGTGSLEAVPLPTVVAGGHRFTHLVAGRMHTCGITTSRDAYCWGWDWTGALGAGDVSPDRCVFFSNDPCSPTPRLVVMAMGAAGRRRSRDMRRHDDAPTLMGARRWGTTAKRQAR